MRMSVNRKIKKYAFFGFLSVVLTMCGLANAEDLTLGSIFTDHMVLQRDKPIKVWGWANVGESVTVTFNGKSKIATAGADNRWEMSLVTEAASKTSRNFTVQGASSTITLTDVLVGDVWLCGGQSNISGAALQTTANRDGGMIRNFRTVSSLAGDWQNEQKNVDSVDGGWISDGNMTTVGFHFAKTVYESLGSMVPIGLIDSSVSGRNVESFMPAMDQATWEAKVPADMRALPKTWNRVGGGYWNCLIAPYAGVSVRGAIWYQGEENAKFGEYQQYAYKMWAMVKGWRDAWGEGDFSFIETQLCSSTAVISNDADILTYAEIIALRDNLTAQTPIDYYRFATIREAQEMACGIIDNMYMTVIADLGANAPSVDVHIALHDQAGQRIARVALNKEYGQSSVVCDGPTYSSHVTEGNTIRISFNNVGTGLITQYAPSTPAGSVSDGNDVYGFHIQGNDGAWHIADATLDTSNNTIVVSKIGVTSPINVRYSFETNPYKCNVYAKDGMPLVQFKTDGEGAIPGVTVDPTFGLETTEAGGVDTFTVVLDTAPTADVTISLTSGDITEGTVSSTSLTFTSANWDTPQTVIVTGVDDGDVDGWVDYTITAGATSSSDTSYNGLAVTDVAVKNQDDEVGTPGITVNPTTGLTTTEAGGTATFTVVLDASPAADVTISLASSDITEGTVSPSSLTFTFANWNTLQIVTITGVDDTDMDGDVAYTITTGDAASSDANYSGMTVADVSVTNSNDDIPDTVAPAQIYGLNAQIGGAAAKLNPISVSATSQYSPDYESAKAIDGDGGTLWVSGNQGVAGVTQSITLDLGASKQIEKVRLQAPVSGDAWNYANFPSDFTVEISTDNTSWTTVITESGYTATSGSWYEKTFAAQEAQYVRFVADTTQVNTWSIYTIRLAEFEVYAPATADQVSLTWTAVGDDENTGTATTYDLRYSTTGPIDTDAKWDAATQVADLPAPQPAESEEYFLVPTSTFNLGDTVYFCIKTADEVPNWSLRSNTDASVMISDNAEYTISYDDNTAGSGTAPADQTKTDGITLIIAGNSGSLEKSGYAFVGWNTSTDGSGTHYDEGASYTTDADMTLYAEWLVAYTVHYDANGADSGTAPADQIKKDGVDLVLASNSGNLDINTGDFDGWNTAANGSGTDYAAGATYSTDADITLYAKWALDTTPPAAVTDLAAVIAAIPGEKLPPASVNTSSQYNPDYSPANAIDEDATTAWVTSNAGVKTDTLTLDLGESKEIGKIRIQMTSTWSENFPSPFTIDVSTNGTSWTTVFTESSYTPVDGAWYEKEFTAETARYVRMTADTKSLAAYPNIYTYRLAEFEVYAITENKVKLTWTAPGDDGNTGTATSYDMRYSTTGAIDDNTKWSAATVITDLPTPQVAGSAEMFTIALSTFNAGDTVHFNLKSTDDAGNVSDLANADANIHLPGKTTVTYHANGATSGEVPPDQIKREGIDLTLATNSGNLKKIGLVFVGWNTVADSTGVDYSEGATYSTDADMTLYAKWKPAPTLMQICRVDETAMQKKFSKV